MMIKNIVFDMGNVLLSHCPDRYLHKIFRDEAVIQAILKELFCGPEWPMLDEGIILEEDALKQVKARIPQYATQVQTAMDSWHTDLLPILGMTEILCTLKESGYHLYLLSNMHLRFYDFADSVEMLHYMDDMMVSAHEKLMKPNIQIYQRFCLKFNVKAEECLFIDDREENIEGAIRAGWQGHCFTTPEELKSWMTKENILT